MVLQGRLALLVGLGVIPVALLSTAGLPPWLLVAAWLALCIVATIIDITASGDPRQVSVQRRLPARARLGERVAGEIVLHNRGTRTLRGLLRDGWQPTAGASPERLVVAVAGGERQRLDFALNPRRRGELRTAFVVVRSIGPLGLAGRQRMLAEPASLRVLPPFSSRRHLPSRLNRLRELDGSTSVQVRGRGTEFDSLREYVRGDDVRSIDWRATARAGTTMLRTWRPERDRHVVILIDSGRTSAARVGDGTRLDAAMEASLLLAALASRAGDHVHLVVYDRLLRARVTGVDGPALLPALVDALVSVEPQLIDTDWDAAFAQVRRVTSHPALIVVLTAQDAAESARGFLGSLPALTRRSLVLVGTATDNPPPAPELFTAEDVYRAAASARAQREAGVVSVAMTRAGADAIADSPEALPPRIADRYLALKAAGRL